MPSKSVELSSANARSGVAIERGGDVLTFTLDNVEHGKEVTGPMFDAKLAELRAEPSRPSARVLRIRARGKDFCTRRARAGKDVGTIHKESARHIEIKRALRVSRLVSIAEAKGDFGFGFWLAIACDFVYVTDDASLGFPEMRFGLAPAAIMAYLGEYSLPHFAFPFVLFGDPIGPQRALQIGLISHVSPAGSLIADALAVRILQLETKSARRCEELFQTPQQNSFDQNCRPAVEALTVTPWLCLQGRK